MFLAALDQAGGTPDRALVVGDTGWDVEAARAAQVSTVAERTGGWGHEELVQAGAIEVHAGTWALVEQLDATAIGDLLRR